MNRNFMSHPNQTFWRAVVALRQLLLAQDLDTVQRAYAEAIWHERQRAYLQGMTSPGDTHVCLHRLLGEPCPGADCASPRNIPGFDHGSEWQTNGKTTRLVFQPKGS